jgi:hypothetical protein
MPSPVVFRKASVFCYRIFDIADEIGLEKAQTVLTADARRLRLSREGSQYLQLPNPPLAIELGKKYLSLRDGPCAVDAVARVFDHGAASVILKVPVVPGLDIERLIPLVDELYDSQAVDQLCLELLEGLRRVLAPAIEGAHLWDQSESYTVIFVEHIDGNPSAKEIEDRAELARLLLGEVENHALSEYERREVTQHRFSYRETDLVIVDWNSAFVYEPTGSLDIPDILEISNAQLLELRFYDDLLDTNVRRIYAEVQRKRRSWYSIFRSPYNLLARRVLAMMLEMSEFVERVENSLKIIGDFYLAKVYEASLRRLRIPAWQASVTRKQQMLADVYQLLKGDVDINRSLTLEFTIVILIVTELLLGFVSILSR